MFTVEVETSSGASYRWAPDHPNIENRCRIGPWATQLADGFGQSTVELARRPDVAWPDLGRMDTIRYRHDDGSIAYEGRIHTVARATGRSVTVESVGWATYLSQKSFTEIYVDRDIGNWHEAPTDERDRIANVPNVYGELYSVEIGTRAIHFKGTAGYAGNTQAIGSGTQVQAWYTAPTSRAVAQLTYRGEDFNVSDVTNPLVFSTDDEDLGAATTNALTLDDTLRDRTIDPPTRRIALKIQADVSHTKGGNPAHRIYKKIAVYGDHDVTLSSIESQPSGVIASDVIDDVLSRFAPKVALETQGTTYPIGHLVFIDPVTPYEAIQRCNEFHHWRMEVYEGPTLHFQPIDLGTATWHVRDDWEGASVIESESSDEFVNGVPVSYEDIESGRTEVLWPDENEELRNDDPENPANRWGEDKWGETLSVPFPCTANDALRMGEEHLLDLNTPQHPTSAIVPRRVKDAQGNWQPAHKVRAGDTLAIDTHPHLGVMLITSTSFDPQTNTVDIGTDYEISTLEVFFARMDAARVGRL